MNHNSTHVRWFKARAKALLAEYRAGDEAARALFHRWNRDGPAGLQKMQHALARSTGYRSWHALLAASEETLARSVRVLEGKLS